MHSTAAASLKQPLHSPLGLHILVLALALQGSALAAQASEGASGVGHVTDAARRVCARCAVPAPLLLAGAAPAGASPTAVTSVTAVDGQAPGTPAAGGPAATQATQAAQAAQAAQGSHGRKDTQDAQAPRRARIGLVLSGGGVRGLARVGVLQALRELRVPVDIVVGTSMGAIVGGAFAAGHPVEVLEQYAVETDWGRVFDPVGDRRDIDFRRRRDDAILLPAPTLRSDPDGLTIAPAPFGSFELEMLLRRIAAPVRDTADLDRLPLRYRAVAADLVNGEMVLLRQTTLFNAMRASMSVPGAFAPLRVDGRLLIDGGVVRNLPVDVARALGADIVLAVNVGAPPVEEAKLRTSLDITLQMVSLLIQQNVAASLAQLGPRDVLVQSDLSGIGSADFSRPAEVVERGRRAALAQAPALAGLALPPAEYALWESSRQLPQAPPQFVIESIEFKGTERADPRGLAARLPFSEADKVDEATLEQGLRRLYASGDFDRIDYALVPLGPTSRRLLLQPQERVGGMDSLRFGWHFESDLADLNRFNVAVGYLRPWVNAYGGEWRTLVQLGSERLIETELYQPLLRRLPFFAAVGARYFVDDQDIFASEQRRLARVSLSYYGVEAAFGMRLGSVGELRLGLQRRRIQADNLIGQLFESRITALETFGTASLQLDALDNPFSPREGYRIDLQYARLLNSGSTAVQTGSIEL